MKKLFFVLMVAGGLMYCSIGRADITSVSCQDDGDGVISCGPYMWSGSITSVTMDGTQHTVPGQTAAGHILGDITTDSTTDPTLTLDSAINNDTGYAWTAYDVNVYMDNPFSLSSASVTLPPDWTLASIQPTAVPVVSPHGSYEASMVFASGTPVAIGDDLDFGYTISFTGSTDYSFTQEMIPVPEPGTIGFLAAGVLLLGGLVVVRQRRNRLS
ncbi:MAG: PEP-CTERM sorting domain-containing protein [Verrucomicrobiia bacterium]